MANVLLISYDNDSHLPFFPMNLFYLAGSLKKAGHRLALWAQYIHHGREEALTEILDRNPLQVVGLGFCAGYYQYGKAKKVATAVNASVRRKDINFVLGGHGPGGAPEFFLEKLLADTVVVGDGERAIRLAAHGKKGIIQGDPCTTDHAPLEIYSDLFPMLVYRLIRWPTSERKDFCFPILSSRGCKWSCSFCFRMREGFHYRDVAAIAEGIKYLHNNWQITHFQFSDELLMGCEERTAEICESILKLPFGIKWDCNGRLNFARKEILSLMKDSGAEYVNYGIESLDQRILNEMGKGLTVERIHEGVQGTLEAGLSPGLNFLWGFPGDTEDNLNQMAKFIKKYNPGHELRTIRPVTPYPGCRLYKEAIDKNLLDGPEDFYERKHLNSDLFSVNFMDMPVERAHELLFKTNAWLASAHRINWTRKMVDAASAMYTGKNLGFRGFRAV